ncbi:YfcL protein [Oceanospirillum multiglobuliferum]|uniref:YfcL family protein n=1 Tax=Oceanospirillum multiglobuliferum TaxID=64969 RepID=A0A1T4N9N0_9GAMM|nr:YfcL family protein [Oceanospirillum multiglobuliferum]OPX55884.1 hypothetical protein BTE48_06735 [Oceanospirillum multiglobuliferum]SJZ75793.1 YfcL protein [Oceanospirillum multiglobuliferum]
MDSFIERADKLSHILREMEKSAAEDELFALGYLIPQLTLVAEYVEPQPHFDQCFTDWLEQVFADDKLSINDQKQIMTLWQSAIEKAGQ